MSAEFFAVLIGIIVGGLFTWIVIKLLIQSNTIPKKEYELVTISVNEISTELMVEKERSKNLSESLRLKDIAIQSKTTECDEVNRSLASKLTEYSGLRIQYEELKDELNISKAKLQNHLQETQILDRTLSTEKANREASNLTINNQLDTIAHLKLDLKTQTEEFNETNKKLATATAINNAQLDKLEMQKTEMENLRKQFNTEFENIATKVLEEKSSKFTKLNQENIETLLKPLGQNIETFKKKVEEVYDKESKERFSLGKEVEKLVTLNHKISEDANNLANALKGNSKTQGDWGQMILESILEKSGLVKDRQYFVQNFLEDEDGNYIKNEDGSKMQPDVIIIYPDNRKVIVDAKVSLTAYTRYIAAETSEEQTLALNHHIKSIIKHIDDLSKKSYQDFAPSLDFMIMFVPNEPACLIALQHDPTLWQYAYSKRIILISPTNLITSLKLIEDLWKRENQNKNAQEIAKRGAALYDKFVGFVDNILDIKTNLDKTQRSYDTAFRQLKDGSGNLIGQAEKLRDLGVKPKGNLPPTLLTDAIGANDN
jgi:DNA recombination protein RmuC